MPKPKYDYTKFAVNHLLNLVKEKSKLDLNNIESSKRLSKKLAENKIYLSFETLARQYKILPSKSVPYKNTLDKLSSYLGYQSWDNFYTEFRKKNDKNSILTDTNSNLITESELMLLKFCIEDNAFNPVINYLNKISDYFINPYSFDSQKIANQIGSSIRNNKVAQKTLIPVITKNEISRDMFYTWWVDMDGLNNYYADYISKTYLKYLHPRENNYILNEIWAYSILMYHALYTDNMKSYSNHAYVLFQKYKPEEIILSGGYDYFPFARFHANHIIYNSLMKTKNNKWFETKVLFIKNEITKINKQFQIVVISHIIEALVISKKPELAMLFIDEYEILLEKFLKNNRITEEEDSLIKLIFYFHYIFKKLNLLEQKLFKPISELKGKPPYSKVNFYHSYSWFFSMIKQYYTDDLQEKNTHLNKAVQHARIIKNKLFLKLSSDLTS